MTVYRLLLARKNAQLALRKNQMSTMSAFLTRSILHCFLAGQLKTRSPSTKPKASESIKLSIQVNLHVQYLKDHPAQKDSTGISLPVNALQISSVKRRAPQAQPWIHQRLVAIAWLRLRSTASSTLSGLTLTMLRRPVKLD